MDRTDLIQRPKPGIQGIVPPRPITWVWVLVAVLYRPVFFALWQGVFAAFHAAQGAARPWESSTSFWPVSATLTGFVGLGLLTWLYQGEGSNFFQLYGFDRKTWLSDLLVFLAFMLVSGPVSYLPTVAVATWLFGRPEVAYGLMAGPLPDWLLAVSLVAFPIMVALTELPTYFGYVMPRVEALSGSPRLGLLLPVFVLSAQHIALPLVFDWRFIVWRLTMFFPFALMAGFLLRWRPRLLPYAVIGHAFIDALVVLALF